MADSQTLRTPGQSRFRVQGDAAVRTGQRIVRSRVPDPDRPGETKVVEEAIPNTASIKMIDPDGNVVPVSIAGGRNLDPEWGGVPLHAQANYGDWVKSKKRREGWLIYDEVPEAEREQKIAERKAKHTKDDQRFRRQGSDMVEKEMQRMTATMAAGQAAGFQAAVEALKQALASGAVTAPAKAKPAKAE